MKYCALLLILLCSKAEAQEVFVDYSTEIDCEMISKGLIDSELYNRINGRVFAKEIKDRSETYRVTIVENKKTFYVSQRLKDIINKKNCAAFTIERISTIDNRKVKKLVRD